MSLNASVSFPFPTISKPPHLKPGHKVSVSSQVIFSILTENILIFDKVFDLIPIIQTSQKMKRSKSNKLDNKTKSREIMKNETNSRLNQVEK